MAVQAGRAGNFSAALMTVTAAFCIGFMQYITQQFLPVAAMGVVTGEAPLYSYRIIVMTRCYLPV